MDNILKWVYYISIAASLIISFLGMAGVFAKAGVVWGSTASLAWNIAVGFLIVAFITLSIRCYRYRKDTSGEN